MPTLTDLNIDPYFDDFDEDKKYLRTLFRPGYAVQARELNQLQTVLQNQVERFGTHIFKNGAMVVPGKNTLDLEYSYITIEPYYLHPNTDVVETPDVDESIGDEIVDPSVFLGAVLTNSEDPGDGTVPALEAVVVNVVDRDRTDLETGDSITLYVKYEKSQIKSESDADDEDSADDIVSRYSADDVLFIKSISGIQNDPSLTSGNSYIKIKKSGFGSALHMQKGIYYVNGFFHRVNDSTLILDKYSATPTYSIGFQVVEELLTPEEDSSLRDNALGSSNFKAPGAHRLKINLELIKKKLTLEDDSDFTLAPEELPAIDYVEIMKVRDGLIEEQVRTTQYNILEDTLSRRIYDQSGNFVVDPFSVTVIEHLEDGENDGFYKDGGGDDELLNPDGTIKGNEDKYIAAIDEGKAYVYGREVDTIGLDTKYLSAWKARTDGTNNTPNHISRKNNVPTSISIGNYVYVGFVDDQACVPQMSGYPAIDIMRSLDTNEDFLDQAQTIPHKIGEARIRAIDPQTTYQPPTDPATGITPPAVPVYKLYIFDIRLTDERYTFFDDAVELRYKDGSNRYMRMRLFNHENVSDPFYNNENYDTNDNVGGVFLDNESVPHENRVYETSQNTLVYPVPHGPAKSLYDVTYETVESFDVSAPADGSPLRVGVQNFASVERTFVSENVVVFEITTDNGLFSSPLTFTKNAQSNVLISNEGTNAGSIYRIVARIANSDSSTSGTGSGRVRTKTSKSKTFGPIKLENFDADGVFELVDNDVAVSDATCITVTTVLTNAVDPLYYDNDGNETTDGTGQSIATQSSSPEEADAGDSINYAGWDSASVVNEWFELDDGTRDNFYGIAKVILKEGQTLPEEGVFISVDYFEHGTGDYFSVDSYKDFDYEEIPVYETDTGQVIPLANAVDFRPTQTDSDSVGTDFNTDSNYASPDSIFRSDIDFYIGRIDKVVVSDDGNFDIITGKPALDPVPPAIPENSIVLHTLEVPPYTFGAEDIKVKSQEYKRYTMDDLSKMEKRIDSIEYYTSLNLLEKETSELNIIDSNGLDKFKNGFIVDPFSSQSVGNSQDPDFAIAIDLEESQARPESSTKAIDFVDDTNTYTNVRQTGDLITLDYKEVTFVQQFKASDTISVNPFAVFSWNGLMKITPTSDYWFSTEYRPAIQIDGGTVDSARYTSESKSIGTVWNAWQTTWAGTPTTTSRVTGTTTKSQRRSSSSWSGWRRVAGRGRRRRSRRAWAAFRRRNGRGRGVPGVRTQTTRTWTDTTTSTTIRQVTSRDLKQQRTGVRTRAITRVEKKQVGDRQVGRYFIPWIREKIIDIKGERFKPNTVMHVYFDNKLVDYFTQQYVKDSFSGKIINRRHKGFITDDAGKIEGAKLHIPNKSTKTFPQTNGRFRKTVPASVGGGSLRFRAGARNIVITNGRTVNDDQADSRAEASYRAQGTMNVRQRSILTTRVRDIVKEPLSSQRTVNQTLRDRSFTNTTQQRSNPITTRRNIEGWFDPLAESFLTDMEGGMFITSVEIPFTQVDPNIPVSVQIREMDNGYPAPRILPFGEVTKYPHEINLPRFEGQFALTKFVFDSPIYIKKNIEHCFVIFSNSEKYFVRYAKMGKKDFRSGDFITKQPYIGVMFKSQNNSTWTADQEADLTFRINRAEFKSDSGSVEFIPNIPENDEVTESNPFRYRLKKDPFYTITGNSYVKVEHDAHGFAVGDVVVFDLDDEITDTSFHGIPVSTYGRANGHEIKFRDLDYYIIDVGTNANKTGPSGGEDHYAIQNISADVAHFNATFIEPTGTSIDWGVTTKPFGEDELVGPYDITINDNVEYARTMSIEYETMEDDCQMLAQLSSTSNNISPVIDVERCSAYFVRNRINQPYYETEQDRIDKNPMLEYEGHLIHVPETGKKESTNECKYVTRGFSLANPSDSIKIYIDVNKPDGSDIEVYYKTIPVGSKLTFVDQKYKPLKPVAIPQTSDDDEDFREHQWEINAEFYEELKTSEDDRSKFEEFQTFVIKVVLTCDNTTNVPKLKNFRAIALA